MKNHKKRLAVALAAGVLSLGVLPASAQAASGSWTFATGCGVNGSNSYSSNWASASTSAKSGTTTYTVMASFRYWDPNTGTEKIKDSGYVTGTSVTVGAATNAKPTKGSWHGCQATSGGQKWSANLGF